MVKIRADFSEASEGGQFNPKNVEEGDYLGKVKACELGVSKAGNKQLVFTIEAPEIRGATYPLYCAIEGKAAWKFRQLLESIGKKVPKAAANIETDNLIGKSVGIELVDDEYDGRMKSVINSVFPAADVNKESDAADDVDDDDEDEPPVKKTTARKKAAPVVEEYDDEDEDEEEEPEPPARTRKPASKRRAPEPEPEPEDDEDDYEDEDEEEEPAPAPRRRPVAKKAPAKKVAPARRRKPAPIEDDDDEDLDEIDIEEL